MYLQIHRVLVCHTHPSARQNLDPVKTINCISLIGIYMHTQLHSIMNAKLNNHTLLSTPMLLITNVKCAPYFDKLFSSVYADVFFRLQLGS